MISFYDISERLLIPGKALLLEHSFLYEDVRWFIHILYDDKGLMAKVHFTVNHAVCRCSLRHI